MLRLRALLPTEEVHVSICSLSILLTLEGVCVLSFQLSWIASHLITGGKPKHGRGVGQEHLLVQVC